MLYSGDTNQVRRLAREQRDICPVCGTHRSDPFARDCSVLNPPERATSGDALESLLDADTDEPDEPGRPNVLGAALAFVPFALMAWFVAAVWLL